MKKSIALLLAASTLVLVGCCTTHQATKWEYKTVVDMSDAFLNRLGAEGWSVVGFQKNADLINVTVLLKRPKQ